MKISKILFVSLFTLICCGPVWGQFGRSMSDVILPSTDAAEWMKIKKSIKGRILEYWGEGPLPYAPLDKPNYRVDSNYVAHGLTHIVIRYEVIPGSWDRGILVLPKSYSKKQSYKAVITIHGTNGVKGADGLLDYDGRRDHSYPIELANKGFICFVPDHFAFGDWLKDISQQELYKQFTKQYPDWSLTGRQLLGFIRSVDVVDALQKEYNIEGSGGYGVMGHSLGGRTALYLAAFDDRISSGVVSTGISPMISNTYRGLFGIKKEQPRYWDSLVKSSGLYPWELNEVIALCAPKNMLFLEPINDNYNPYVDYTVQALMYAAPVWRMLKKAENYSFLIHGDAHQTDDYLRDYAYHWLIRKLK